MAAGTPARQRGLPRCRDARQAGDGRAALGLKLDAHRIGDSDVASVAMHGTDINMRLRRAAAAVVRRREPRDAGVGGTSG